MVRPVTPVVPIPKVVTKESVLTPILYDPSIFENSVLSPETLSISKFLSPCGDVVNAVTFPLLSTTWNSTLRVTEDVTPTFTTSLPKT